MLTFCFRLVSLKAKVYVHGWHFGTHWFWLLDGSPSRLCASLIARVTFDTGVDGPKRKGKCLLLIHNLCTIRSSSKSCFRGTKLLDVYLAKRLEKTCYADIVDKRRIQEGRLSIERSCRLLFSIVNGLEIAFRVFPEDRLSSFHANTIFDVRVHLTSPICVAFIIRGSFRVLKYKTPGYIFKRSLIGCRLSCHSCASVRVLPISNIVNVLRYECDFMYSFIMYRVHHKHRREKWLSTLQFISSLRRVLYNQWPRF